MKSSFLAIGILVLLCASLEAATYYISPSGNDGALGTAITTPWKTFAYAVPKLKPGDVLVLLDGTFDDTNSGFLVLSNLHGTATQPITFRAQNERKAHLHNNGLATSIRATDCSYLNFEGLRVSSADNSSVTNTWTGTPMGLADCDHIVARRLLIHRNNRYGNTHLLSMQHVTNSLIEDAELYYFHRHGIAISHNSKGASSNNVIRRLYCNAREGDIAGGRPSGNPSGGDAGVTVYPGSNTIIENQISDGNQTAFDIQAVGPSDNNQFLGIISLNGQYGTAIRARPEQGNVAAAMPKNNLIRNFVVLNPTAVGVYCRGVKNQRLEHITVLNSSIANDVETGIPGDGVYSVFAENILATGSKSYGFGVTSHYQTWTADHINSFGNATAFVPATSPNYIAPTTIDPKLGTCKVWIPDSSPMKKAGKNGEDIGANILYRYKDGVLTNEPLWDPATGAFPCGAIVAGFNDVPGKSCFDVHTRLNVNRNGCPFPAGYPTTSAITNPRTNNASVAQNGFLTITPNFGGSSITIGTDAAHPAMIEIYNLQGKKMETLNSMNGGSVQWQRGNQPAGVYFVKASSRGITATAKLFCGR